MIFIRPHIIAYQGGWVLASLLCPFENFQSWIYSLASQEEYIYRGLSVVFLQYQWWSDLEARGEGEFPMVMLLKRLISEL